MMTEIRKNEIIDCFVKQIKALGLKPQDWTTKEWIRLGNRVILYADDSGWVSDWRINSRGQDTLTFVKLNHIPVTDIEVPFDVIWK